ncbi:hypothetical protein [Methylobacterium sp. NEAU K]|uniref:hypothetical protein n=1 Tax=Methylobacterium sp. NEAU K TaxID=3064946 RepID=UPI0027329168|nr:hypothetical protein [Methylobacterium sp. NEAU K]MDP4005343.1 hypothetical protein [Methylobacterium sp. NEAU K]
MNDEDPDFEHSPFSGPITREGETVEVEIYRFVGTRGSWRLEVVHLSGGCTEWPDRFAIEEDAYKAFCAAVEEHGLAPFCVAAGKTLH